MTRRRFPVAWAVVTAAALLAGNRAGAADPSLTDAAGSPVDWSAWLTANGPAAMLVWASWAPGAEAAIAALPDLTEAARSQGLGLVVIDVQEEVEAARGALERARVPWLHDRHGSILKQYRLIRLPILLVVDRQGRGLATLEPSADALRRLPR